MDKLRFEGTWNEVIRKLKEKYGELTDDNLTYTKGKEDQLIVRLQKQLEKSKDEVREIIRKT